MDNLVSLEQYKLYLNKQYDDSAKKNEDDLYYSNLLLPSASSALRSYFDNDFQSIERTETISIECTTNKIFPKYKPIESVSSVSMDGVALLSTDYELLLDQNAIVLSGGGAFPRGFNNIVIVYTGGYALTRDDYGLLCKLIAQVDDNDSKAFSSADGAEDVFFSKLNENTVFMNMVKARFRNYNL